MAALGKVAYKYWHVPLRELRYGLVTTERARRGEALMRERALSLARPPGPLLETRAEIHLLTGVKHWHQTAFCLYSLLCASGGELPVFIHTDGTALSAEALQTFAALHARMVDPVAEAARVSAALPSDRHPTLWKWRGQLPLMRKLMDVHAGAPGWKLFLDSDMLFWRRPRQILDWLRSPDGCVCQYDTEGSIYGYAPEVIRAACGLEVPGNVNSGVCGMRSDAIDWAELESWAARLDRHGTLWHAEQCLTAMLFARAARFAHLPPKEYLLMPDFLDVWFARGALHHYAGTRRRHYYAYAWKLLLERTGGPGLAGIAA